VRGLRLVSCQWCDRTGEMQVTAVNRVDSTDLNQGVSVQRLQFCAWQCLREWVINELEQRAET
jgi:hypothetical protein